MKLQFMKLQLLGKTTWMSMKWSVFTMFFGLLQIWLILASNLIDKSTYVSLEEIIMDGGLLFFSTAILASITIDYHLSKSHYSSDFMIFSFIPLFIIMICVWLSTKIHGKSPEDIDFHLTFLLELGIFSVVIIYTFSVKLFVFYANENEANNRKNNQSEYLGF